MPLAVGAHVARLFANSNHGTGMQPDAAPGTPALLSCLSLPAPLLPWALCHPEWAPRELKSPTAQSQQGAGIGGQLPDPFPLSGLVRAGAHVHLSHQDFTAPVTRLRAQTFPHAQLPPSQFRTLLQPLALGDPLQPSGPCRCQVTTWGPGTIPGKQDLKRLGAREWFGQSAKLASAARHREVSGTSPAPMCLSPALAGLAVPEGSSTACASVPGKWTSGSSAVWFPGTGLVGHLWGQMLAWV